MVHACDLMIRDRDAHAALSDEWNMALLIISHVTVLLDQTNKDEECFRGPHESVWQTQAVNDAIAKE